MSYGLPGIVTPIASEPIIHEKNGFIVPYCDSDIIAYWLRRLYNSKEMRERIGYEAKETAKEYTWEKFSNNISKAIEDIIYKEKLLKEI
jgi:glycosyltransferase involved in cell wall biosynthesis